MAYSYSHPAQSSSYRPHAYGYGADHPYGNSAPQIFEGYQPIVPSYGTTDTSSQHHALFRNGDAVASNGAPPSKRLRMDDGLGGMTSIRHHQSSTTLPPITFPGGGLATNDTSRYSEPAANGDISASLEQQVRELADYDHANLAPDGSAPMQKAQQPIRTDSAGKALSQKGAAPGDILRLSCVKCQKSKQDCTKNFPCTECVRAGIECVPRQRQTGQKRPAAGDGEQQAETRIASRRGDGTTLLKGYKVDDPKRKFLSQLPPVLGSHQEWSNKRTKYTPFPEDLDPIRKKLFDLERPILLTSQQIADYWFYMTNIFVRDVSPKTQANGAVIETWECRNFHRASQMTGDEGTGQRKSSTKKHLLETEDPCNFRFRIVYFTKHADTEENHETGFGSCRCLPEWLHLERAAPLVNHNHSLKSADQFKRADSLISFARQKVEEGAFMYSSVRRWIQEQYGAITSQTEFLTVNDIANASRLWRSQHKDLELIATIPAEPTQEVDVRQRGLDLLSTSTTDGLKRALTEVLRRVPESMNFVLPVLEAAQQNAQFSPDSNRGPVLEGDEIEVPHPGLPGTTSATNDSIEVRRPGPTTQRVQRGTPAIAQTPNKDAQAKHVATSSTVAYQLPDTAPILQRRRPGPRPKSLDAISRAGTIAENSNNAPSSSGKPRQSQAQDTSNPTTIAEEVGPMSGKPRGSRLSKKPAKEAQSLAALLQSEEQKVLNWDSEGTKR